MSLYGAFAKDQHLAELGDPLSTSEGILAPATRRLRALQNLLGDSDITIAEVLTLQGVTSGTVAAGKAVVAGAASDDVLDFSSITLATDKRLIKASSVDFENVTGWMSFSGNTTTGYRYSAYFQPSTDGDAHLLGISNTAFALDGATIDRAQSLSAHIIVNSGARVASRSGDAVAGVHPVWAKVQGDVGATWDSGMRIAPVWSDMQVNGVDVSGEETWGLFVTAGGSLFNSIIRTEGTGGGADHFLNVNAALGAGYLDSQGGGAYEAVNTNAQTGNLVVNLNGTLYGIPLMAHN